MLLVVDMAECELVPSQRPKIRYGSYPSWQSNVLPLLSSGDLQNLPESRFMMNIVPYFKNDVQKNS